MKLFVKANAWFDRQSSATRFNLFWAVLVLGVFSLSLGRYFGNVPVALVGLGLMGVLGLMAATYARSLGGVHHMVARAMIVVMVLMVLAAAAGLA